MRAGVGLAMPYHVFPLRVIKQIVCMFLSVNASGFRDRHHYLARFVLNREMKWLPPEYRIYVGYQGAGRSRFSGVMGSLTLDDKFGSGTTRVYSEISFRPFSYILSIDSESPAHEMFDMTWFARYSIDEFASLHLPLPRLDLYTVFPGDFRSRELVRSQAEQNRQEATALAQLMGS
jgi:hypothetical protein